MCCFQECMMSVEIESKKYLKPYFHDYSLENPRKCALV